MSGRSVWRSVSHTPLLSTVVVGPVGDEELRETLGRERTTQLLEQGRDDDVDTAIDLLVEESAHP